MRWESKKSKLSYEHMHTPFGFCSGDLSSNERPGEGRERERERASMVGRESGRRDACACTFLNPELGGVDLWLLLGGSLGVFLHGPDLHGLNTNENGVTRVEAIEAEGQVGGVSNCGCCKMGEPSGVDGVTLIMMTE